MSMRRTHTLRVANGTYVVDGQEKTRWLTVGGLMEDDNKLKIKFDAMPVGNTWDGWVQCFPVEESSGNPKFEFRGDGTPVQPPNNNQSAVTPAAAFDDDIPF